MSNNYSSDDITNLEGLEPVKRRPGMYTDTENPNHLALEVIDNSIDEALEGHASKVLITIHPDNSVEVEDDGRGMPVDINKKTKMTGVAMILEMLHSGGKFSADNYKISGGLHGVGVSVVNALSSNLEVYVKRYGKTHYTRYSDGHVIDKLTPLKDSKCAKTETGTRVIFKANPTYFVTDEIDEKALREIIKSKAILFPNLEISFTNRKGETDVYLYSGGINEFLCEQNNIDDCIGDIQFVCEGENQDPFMSLEWGVYFANTHTLGKSYANLIPTALGGTHVDGLKSGLFNGLKEFASFHELLPKNITLKPNDVWQNANYVISFKMHEPQFKGQTKDKLASRECSTFISNYVRDSFSLFLSQNKESAILLVEKCLSNARKRVREAKKVERKELGKLMAIPGKLTDCVTNQYEDAELFIVEGDSAGGSAVQGRDRETQAILPLKGKILNSWELDADTILQSDEINNISAAIGVNPNSDDLSKLRYNKICILADADSDGLHIGTLFVALMFKHFLPLVERGHIFVAMPPLYRIDVGKKVFYALDDMEKESVLRKIKEDKLRGEVHVQRFKGLGEMNPDQLEETTLNPLNRRLVQLTVSDLEATTEMLDMLLSKKRANHRREWLNECGNNFELES